MSLFDVAACMERYRLTARPYARVLEPFLQSDDPLTVLRIRRTLTAIDPDGLVRKLDIAIDGDTYSFFGVGHERTRLTAMQQAAIRKHFAQKSSTEPGGN